MDCPSGRVARVNASDRREVVEVPELRIVDQALWDSVKARQAEVGFAMRRDAAGNALNRAHRRKYLLSGLLACGGCGAPYIIVGREHFGCSAHRAKGTCPNGMLIRRSEIERRVLAGIKEKLLAPDLVAAFITSFQAEVNRSARDNEARQAAARAELTALERKIERLVTAIEDGLYDPTVKARLDELQTRKATLQRELAQQRPSSVRFHPNLAELYRQKVAALEEALNAPETRAEAAEVMRGLIEKIVLTPRDDASMSAELYGDLAQILALGDGEEGRTKANRPPLESGGRLSVVAGARNHLYRTLLHWNRSKVA